MAAVLPTWFPGQEAGHGPADLLFGPVRPPRTGRPTADHLAEGLHLGYRAWHRSTTRPAYWFGHGLGYTTWAYEHVTTTVSGIQVRLRNTGNRPGHEVVQVYVTRPTSAIDRPERWLATWTKATADPGETVELDIHIPDRAYQHRTPTGWTTEPGTFTLLIGPSSATTPLTTTTSLSPFPTHIGPATSPARPDSTWVRVLSAGQVGPDLSVELTGPERSTRET